MDILDKCPDILTVMEAAEVSRIGRTMMYRFIKSGQIRHVKIGKKILIPRIYLQEFLANHVEKCYNDIQMVGAPAPVAKKGV